MELPQEDRDRIRAEEVFRQEVQLSCTRKILTFLNSAFCLWVLSTVVVGLVTSSYNSHKEEIAANAAKAAAAAAVAATQKAAADAKAATYAKLVGELSLSYLGWQQSLGYLARLVEPEIPG